MPRANSLNPNTEELSPGLYRHMGIYAPLVWLLDSVVVCVLHLGLKTGFISRDFLRPAKPPMRVPAILSNRHYRRAKASGFLRLRRHMRKPRKINPDDYMPRVFTAIHYIKMMPKQWSVNQFIEHYSRHTGLSRVQVYGMDSAHAITRYASLITERFAEYLAETTSVSHISSEILSDPAPP